MQPMIMLLYARFIHPSINTYIHTYIHMQPMIVLLYARDYMKGLYGPWTEADTQTWTNALKHTYIHTYIHPLIHTYIHTYIHTCAAHDRAPIRT